MSIEIGAVKIIENIDDNKFFKFKQSKVEYYALLLTLDDEEEGYLVFSLNKEFDRLFRQSNYHKNVMLDLIEEKIERLFFVSFADENSDSEVIEYAAEIGKEAAINIYERRGL